MTKIQKEEKSNYVENSRAVVRVGSNEKLEVKLCPK